jgi:hypothetical protein
MSVLASVLMKMQVLSFVAPPIDRLSDDLFWMTCALLRPKKSAQRGMV